MMRIFPVILLLTLEAVTSCPYNWIESDNFCYKISTGPMNWGSAQEVTAPTLYLQVRIFF